MTLRLYVKVSILTLHILIRSIMQYILDKLKINKEIPTSIFEKVQLAKELDDLIQKENYNKTDNTKHYSEKFNVLLFNLFNDKFDYSKEVIDPFAGKGDLLLTLERFNKISMYDIKPDSANIIQRDTLKNPINYSDKYVVTNPPYLAKNKNEDKTIYKLYKTDDLYKASIKSIINGNVLGGCLIVPINFLTDDNTEDLRKEFFSKYHIENLNIFTIQMFEYTKYNTCSFNFFKGEQSKNIKTIVHNKDKLFELNINLEHKYGYRLFGEFYETLNIPTTVIRYMPEKHTKHSNIVIYCIDGIKDTSLIRAEYVEEIPIIKKSDRNTFVPYFTTNYSKEEQLKIVEYFNNFIKENRNKYYNLIFTNFRENNRKRISFELAYRLLQKSIDDLQL